MVAEVKARVKSIALYPLYGKNYLYDSACNVKSLAYVPFAVSKRRNPSPKMDTGFKHLFFRAINLLLYASI